MSNFPISSLILFLIMACLGLAVLQLTLFPFVILIIPLIIPILIVSFNYPIYLCLGFIVFSFFRIHEAIPVLIPFKIPQLLALGSFSVILWHVFLSEKIKVYWHPLMLLLLIFFGFIAVGAIAATDPGASIGMLQGSFIKIIAMVFAIAWLIRTPKDFLLTTVFILLAGALIGGIAIFNKINGIGLVEGTRVTISRNIGSMIGDPNDLALVLTFPISFALSSIITTTFSRSFRFLSLIVFIILVWAIIATQSRGGLLGLCAVSGTISWIKIKNKLLIIFGGGFLLMILLAAAGISDRSSGGSAEEGIDASAMGRIYAWQAAISMANHNPITGVGLNNFYANYYFHSPHWDGKNHAVHSTWFQVLAEAGYLGFILFLTFVVAIFKLTLKNIFMINKSMPPAIQQISIALLSGLTGFCTSGTFLTQGFIWPLYIIAALTIALNTYLLSQRKTI